MLFVSRCTFWFASLCYLSSFFLVARPLRGVGGGGGGKGRATRKKLLFFICCLLILFQIVNNPYFILRFSKTLYQYSSVHFWQSRYFFTCMLQYFAKNIAFLVQKSFFGYFKKKERKKNVPSSSTGGGFKA